MAKMIVKKMRWPYPIVWIVPLAALVAFGFYCRDYLLDRGTIITITVEDASGLKPSETKVMHRGVEVGEVSDLQLTGDEGKVLVRVRLQRKQEAFARQGAQFWVVRPEISYSGITGLNTVLSGPYIDTLPGSGETQTDFVARPKAPVSLTPGLRIVLNAPQLQHVDQDAPVYYRGVQVGSVQSIDLSPLANGVDIVVFIQQRFAPLVRTTSKFWVVNGFDVKGGILTGVQVKLESLRSLIAGGVTFNSPDDQLGDPAANGANYPLYDNPEKDWPNWEPKIPIPPSPEPGSTDSTAAPTGQQELNKAIKGK